MTLTPSFKNAAILDLATREELMSPQIVIVKFSKFVNSSLMVNRSSKDCEGCSNFPAPAFITLKLN